MATYFFPVVEFWPKVRLLDATEVAYFRLGVTVFRYQLHRPPLRCVLDRQSNLEIYGSGEPKVSYIPLRTVFLWVVLWGLCWWSLPESIESNVNAVIRSLLLRPSYIPSAGYVYSVTTYTDLTRHSI